MRGLPLPFKRFPAPRPPYLYLDLSQPPAPPFVPGPPMRTRSALRLLACTARPAPPGPSMAPTAPVHTHSATPHSLPMPYPPPPPGRRQPTSPTPLSASQPFPTALPPPPPPMHPHTVCLMVCFLDGPRIEHTEGGLAPTQSQNPPSAGCVGAWGGWWGSGCLGAVAAWLKGWGPGTKGGRGADSGPGTGMGGGGQEIA